MAKKAASAKKVGRPSSMTQKVRDTICSRIIAGESLRSICRDDKMPDDSNVFRLLATDVEFRDQYMRARELQADIDADDMRDIADGIGPDGERLIGDESVKVQRDRLRIDTRKWTAARMRPKKYGDRVDHTSSDGTMTPQAVTLDVSKLSLETLKELDALAPTDDG